MEAMALWTPKVEVSKASGGPSVGASTGLWSGHLQPGDLMGGGRRCPSFTGHFSPQSPALAPLPHPGPPRGGPDWEVPKQAGDSTGNGSGGFRKGGGRLLIS